MHAGGQAGSTVLEHPSLQAMMHGRVGRVFYYTYRIVTGCRVPQCPQDTIMIKNQLTKQQDDRGKRGERNSREMIEGEG